MHKCLGRYGYAVNKDGLSPELEKKIKADLTVTTEVLPAYKDFQKPKIYKLYYHNKSQYFLPRFYGQETFGEPDYNGLNEGVPIKVACPQEPLPHQGVALKKLFALYDADKELGGGGVLQLPCGYGKTYCAIKTLCHLGLMGLIIVPTECLMDQWVEAIAKMTAGKARVGIIQQDRVETQDRDFVIAMLHSVCLKDYPAGTFDGFGVTVFDECHHISSETFCKAMMKIRTRFILGLSATPVRRDGLSKVFHAFLGPLIHSEKRAGSNTVTVKKIRLESTSESYATVRMANGTKCTSAMTTNISKFAARNDLIIQLIRETVAQGRKILLLSSRKDHLHDIKKRLDEATIRTVDGVPLTSGFYYGKSGMNRTEHKRILSESAKCDVVLGIDVIAKEGLDIPDLNTLIFSTPPGMEIEQPVGRILRKYHKHLNPIVFDLVDNTGNYTKHSSERDKWYTGEGYIINELKVELDVGKYTEKIRDFIHNKQKAVKPKAAKAAKDQVPDLDLEIPMCVLDVPPEEEPEVKSKLKPEVKPEVKPKLKPKQKCHLDNYCPLPEAEVPKIEDELKKCLI